MSHSSRIRNYEGRRAFGLTVGDDVSDILYI